MTVAVRDNSQQLSYRKKNSRAILRSNSGNILRGFTTLFNALYHPQEATGDRSLDELPDDLRQRVLHQLAQDYEDFKVKPGSSLWKHRKQSYINSLQTYFDARFQIKTGSRIYRLKNKEWTKYFLRDVIKSSLIRGGDPSKLSHIVRCTIDINGLKSINDLSSKVKGDEFLNYTARLLYNIVKKSIMAQYGRKATRFALVSEGGDEFGIYIEFARPVRERDITFIYHEISSGLSFDCSTFLPNQAITRNGGIFIPSSLNYTFHSSAGVSVESLESLLINKKTFDEVKRLINEYIEDGLTCDIEQILTSAILNYADELTEKDKEIYKYKLARSKNPSDSITYQILMRNKEMIKLYKQNKTLSEQLDHLMHELEDQRVSRPSLLNDLRSLLIGYGTPLILKKKMVRP